MAVWFDRFTGEVTYRRDSAQKKGGMNVGNIVVCMNGNYYRPVSGTVTVNQGEDMVYELEVRPNKRYQIAECAAPSTLIKKVHFNPPATVVLWADGSKTVVKTQDGDDFDPEKGLAMAIAKKAMGNQGNYYNEIKKWVEPYEEQNKLADAEIEDALKRFRIAMSLLGKGVDI